MQQSGLGLIHPLSKSRLLSYEHHIICSNNFKRQLKTELSKKPDYKIFST